MNTFAFQHGRTVRPMKWFFSIITWPSASRTASVLCLIESVELEPDGLKAFTVLLIVITITMNKKLTIDTPQSKGSCLK